MPGAATLLNCIRAALGQYTAGAPDCRMVVGVFGLTANGLACERA